MSRVPRAPVATRTSPRPTRQSHSFGPGARRPKIPPKKLAKMKQMVIQEEANNRTQAMEEYQTEIDKMFEEFTEELSSTKTRVITRLERNVRSLDLKLKEATESFNRKSSSVLGAVVSLFDCVAASGNFETTVTKEDLTMKSDGSVEPIVDAVKQLTADTKSLVETCRERIDFAEKKLHQVETALGDKTAEAAYSHHMLQDSLVRGNSDVSECITRTRELGIDLQQQMDALRVSMVGAIDDLLKDTAAVCYDSNVLSHQAGIVHRDNVVSDFFSKEQKARLEQARLLRIVKERLIDLAKDQAVLSESSVKLVKSNLPDRYRTILTSDEQFSRADLLDILDFVSYEPRVTETIIAILDEFMNAEERRTDEDRRLKAAIDRVMYAGEKRNVALLANIPPNRIFAPNNGVASPPVEPLLLASPANSAYRSAERRKRREQDNYRAHAVNQTSEAGFAFDKAAPTSPLGEQHGYSAKFKRMASASSILYSQKQRELLGRLK